MTAKATSASSSQLPRLQKWFVCAHQDWHVSSTDIQRHFDGLKTFSVAEMLFRGVIPVYH